MCFSDDLRNHQLKWYIITPTIAARLLLLLTKTHLWAHTSPWTAQPSASARANIKGNALQRSIVVSQKRFACQPAHFFVFSPAQVIISPFFFFCFFLLLLPASFLASILLHFTGPIMWWMGCISKANYTVLRSSQSYFLVLNFYEASRSLPPIYNFCFTNSIEFSMDQILFVPCKNEQFCFKWFPYMFHQFTTLY